jgi:hypothetical protein
MVDDNDASLFQKHAEERSHQDARTHTDFARAAGQAVILINGGAATAALAFVSAARGNVNIAWASCALFAYVLGVVCGSFMFFCMSRSLHLWSQVWEGHAMGWPKKIRPIRKREAIRWGKYAHRCFWAGIVAFVIGSALVASTMLC